MAKKIFKLDPLARLEIIGELELKTGYAWKYLTELPDEKLFKLLKERG
jgi:hypothetical protein